MELATIMWRMIAYKTAPEHGVEVLILMIVVYVMTILKTITMIWIVVVSALVIQLKMNAGFVMAMELHVMFQLR